PDSELSPRALHDPLPIYESTGVRNHPGVDAESPVALFAARDALENQIARRALFHRVHGRRNVREHAVLRGNGVARLQLGEAVEKDRKSTRLNSSHVSISY